MSDLKFKPLEDLSYEQALQEMEELVNKLDTGENDLGALYCIMNVVKPWHLIVYLCLTMQN